MRAWQYAAITSGLEKSLKLNTTAAVPKPKPQQHLIKVDYVALNPVDYKPAETSLMRRFVIPNPATPGIDFAGTIAQPAQGSDLKVGDKVFGCGPSPFAGGMLAEYAVAGTDSTVRIPEGVNSLDASTIGVAGLTAYQSLVAHNPKRVLINGGSGGTGVFGIQIAKAMGYYVVCTCSGRNVELCKGLGADEVIDYTAGSVTEALKGKNFDHVVDNVMADLQLFRRAYEYTSNGAKYIVVAGMPTLKFVGQNLEMKFWPALLGGGKRRSEGMFAQANVAELERIAKWMSEGKVKAVIDQQFGFEDVPKAFEKLKTGRARGKIVVEVCAKA
ncbi:hypothetical protein LTR64_006644 [Lithohypha guttulata]|uniref:uncharacterized protein n=1 Tax=Lithohypha guttulata TaxID=1690604 RepID=UPI002DDFAA93|nr:hypothetical protein LTR51_004797 [Lithohypha guttulata]